MATTTILAVGGLFAVGVALCGVPTGGSVLYALSLAALAFVFAGLAALLAQLTLHTRGVYTWSLLVLALAYVLRGVGDATGSWVSWLSPLGWAEKAAAFGDPRWWALALPLAAGLTRSAAALRLAAQRDLGSALVRSDAGPDRAATRLRDPIGLAVWIRRPAIVGWLAGGVLLAGMMGSLSQQFLDALSGNPALADAMGLTTGRPLAGLLAVIQLYVAVIATGYVVQAIGTLRAEENSGRLENRLSGTVSRSRWLTAHALVVLGGLMTIVLGASLVLALTSALSTGESAELGPTFTSGLAYLPAECLLAGLAIAIYGIRPRLFGLAWAGYAVVATIALLGPGLRLDQRLLDLSPTTHVGNPPVGAIDSSALAMTSALAATLVAVSSAAFRRRGVPQG